MKRCLFIFFLLCAISNTYASTDCLQKPSCEELGYTQTRSQCTCFEKDILPCPFDINNENYAFCGDLNCKGRCKDVSSLYNGEVNTMLLNQSWGQNGMAPYAASLFYIGDKEGDFGQGKWWLPAIGEWMDLYGTDVNKMTEANGKLGSTGENIVPINAAISALQSKGADVDAWENTGYWSSTPEGGETTWLYNPQTGNRGTDWVFSHPHYMRVMTGVTGLSTGSAKPKVGDVMYADKSYGSAESYDGRKTLVGIIFAVSDNGADVKLIGLKDLTFNGTENSINNFDMDNPYGNTSKKTSWRLSNGSMPFVTVEGVPVYSRTTIVDGVLSACSCPCEFDLCYQQNCLAYNDDCSCKTCFNCYSVQDGQCVLGNCQELCQDALPLYKGAEYTRLAVDTYGAEALAATAADKFYLEDKTGAFGQGKWYIPGLGEWMDLYGTDKSLITSRGAGGAIGNTIPLINSALATLSDKGAAIDALSGGYWTMNKVDDMTYFSPQTGSRTWQYSAYYGEKLRVGLTLKNLPLSSGTPKIGDVLYTDKSYGAADAYNGSKTPAGVIYAVSDDGTTVKIIGLRDLGFSESFKVNNFDPENPYNDTVKVIGFYTSFRSLPGAVTYTSETFTAAANKACRYNCEFIAQQ